MQLFCPACQAAFAGVSRCPRCGALLLMPQEAALPSPREWDRGEHLLHPTPVLRVIVGLLVALGLYLGLRKVAVGLVMAVEPDPTAWWLSFDGLVTVFGIQTLATLMGAFLAGAGRPRGFSVGAVVGGLCGGLFLAAEILGGAPNWHLVLYLQPPLLLITGGLAAIVGARVWPAAADLNMPPPSPPGSRLSSIRLGTDSRRTPDRPTLWGGVLLGAVLLVAGSAFAERTRHTIQKQSAGLLKVESTGQGRFLSWQFATLAGLMGAAFAAAGTGAGVRHGLYVGLLGCLGVIGVCAAQGEPTTPIAYMLTRLDLGAAALSEPAALAAVAGGTLLTGLVGGWLGGVLLLPLAPPHLQNRRLRAGD